MSYSPSMISNNVLKRAFKDNVSVSPMKLQKILYFTASEYAKRTNQPLLSEPFQQWQYGPVLSSVYSEFRSFGSKPITAFAKEANGQAYIVGEDSDRVLAEVIDSVWNSTKGLSAVQLSRITHEAGSAWFNAWQNKERYLNDAHVASDVSYKAPLAL